MNRFNIRVYGILVNEKKQVLVSDEYIRGNFYTKFPGGGLEFGEGTRDCLKREFKEEMNLEIEIGSHIYTTDYFQLSAFNPEQQIVSIYYYVKALGKIAAPLRVNLFDPIAPDSYRDGFDEQQLKVYESTSEIESFRLVDWKDFSEESVTLPIDKIVARMVKHSSNHPS